MLGLDRQNVENRQTSKSAYSPIKKVVYNKSCSMRSLQFNDVVYKLLESPKSHMNLQPHRALHWIGVRFSEQSAAALAFAAAAAFLLFVCAVPAQAENALSGATVTDTCASCPPDKFGAPGAVVDGDPKTTRNLGPGATGAYTLTVAKPISLKKIVLLPSMTPNGQVSYEVQTSKDGVGAWISHGGILTKPWADNLAVEVAMNADTTDVRAVKVIIHQSPSWISMAEIEGYSGVGLWVYAAAGLAALALLGGLVFSRRRRTQA